MSRPVRQTVSGIGTSPVYAVDVDRQYFIIGVGVKISATATYTVEHTFDDVWAANFNPATAVWYPHSVANLVGATTNQDGNFIAPCTGIRVNVAASTGTVTMTIVQGGI